MGLQASTLQATEAQPGFNLAQTAQADTIGSPTYVPPNTSSSIPSSNVVNGSPLNFNPTPSVDNGSSLVAGATSSVASGASTPTPSSSTPNIDSSSDLPAGVTSVTQDANGNYVDQNGNPIDPTQTPSYLAAQNTVNKNESTLESSINNETPESTLLTNAQNANGVPADLTALNTARTNFATEVAGYNTLINNNTNQGIAQGESGIAYQGQNASAARTQAVLAASQATILNALQGNYNAAEALAEKTADLAYTDEQNQIDNMKSLITLNDTNLTTAEKTAAAQIAATAKTMQAQVTQAKTDMKNALTAGVTTPFFKYANSDQVYNSQGQKLTYSQYIAQGGKDNFSNVSTIGKTATTKTGIKVLNGSSNVAATPSFKLGSPQDITQATNNTDTMVTEGFTDPATGTWYPPSGSDGYANPATYNFLYDTWKASGRNISTFQTKFKRYINPAIPTQYKGQ